MVDKNEQLFFSVIIPVYNVEEYLEECVESIVSQKYENYEIILVNDGSTDLSGKICDRLLHTHPQKIKVIHKENQGPLLARDTAVRASDGDYFLFIDADDIFADGIFSEMNNAINKYQADMVIFNLAKMYADGTKVYDDSKYEDDTLFKTSGRQALLKDVLNTDLFNSLCKKCVSRKTFNFETDYSAYKNMIQGEDLLVSLELFDRAERILYKNKPLYIYRMRETSTTHSITLLNYRNIQILYAELNRYARKWNLCDIYDRKNWYLNYAYQVLYSIVQKCESKHKWDKFAEAIKYISNDKFFTDAFRTAKKSGYLKFAYVVVKMVRHQKYKSAYIYLNMLNFFIKTKYKIKNIIGGHR